MIESSLSLDFHRRIILQLAFRAENRAEKKTAVSFKVERFVSWRVNGYEWKETHCSDKQMLGRKQNTTKFLKSSGFSPNIYWQQWQLQISTKDSSWEWGKLGGRRSELGLQICAP